MLRTLHLIFAAIGASLAIYGLITKDFQFQNYMMLSLGLMFLVMSLQQFSEKQKSYGWLLLVTSLFALFVSIQGFLFHT